MMENIFDLLKQKPILSIILGFLLAVFILIFFRDVIVLYIKKKYNLFNEEEIKKAIQSFKDDDFFYSQDDGIEDKIIHTLRSYGGK